MSNFVLLFACNEVRKNTDTFTCNEVNFYEKFSVILLRYFVGKASVLQASLHGLS